MLGLLFLMPQPTRAEDPPTPSTTSAPAASGENAATAGAAVPAGAASPATAATEGAAGEQGPAAEGSQAPGGEAHPAAEGDATASPEHSDSSQDDSSEGEASHSGAAHDAEHSDANAHGDAAHGGPGHHDAAPSAKKKPPRPPRYATPHDFSGLYYGYILAVDPKKKFIFVMPYEEDLPRRRFYLDSRTIYRRDGKKAKLSDLEIGTRVALRFFARNDLALADGVFIVDGDYDSTQYKMPARKFALPAAGGEKAGGKGGGGGGHH